MEFSGIDKTDYIVIVLLMFYLFCLFLVCVCLCWFLVELLCQI